MDFYSTYMDYTLEERRAFVGEAGLSLGYVQQHLYTSPNRSPQFKFPNAVALDEATGGKLEFWGMTAGEVDWGYVRRRLNAAHARGAL